MARRSAAFVINESRNALLVSVGLKTPSGEILQLHFQLASGSSHSQNDLDTATALGLLGHQKLVVADGQHKAHYLCLATIQILSVEATLPLKVAPDQPNLLGLDAMCLLGFEISMRKPQFSIAAEPLPITEVAGTIQWLHWDQFLRNANLTVADLVPVGTLPPPKDAFQAILRLKCKSVLLDLGRSGGNQGGFYLPGAQ
eukprot:m.260447 g.260447  ORF g.260447 m.260447 type:complete len:199 (-) comp23592_c0_seq1:110-706(-)